MKRLLLILPAILLIAVGLYFIVPTSFAVRYWADDFCSATLLKNVGYFAAQVFWWETWTGRFSATAFTGFFELLGPWVVRILPLLLLGFLAISLKRFYRISKLLPVLFVFLVLANVPNIVQSFYWQTGAFNYLAPFIFLNIFLGLVVFPPKKVNVFLPAILLFIAGGFSESYALAQLVLLFFVLIAVKVTNFSKKTERLKTILAGIIGAVLALGLMYISPGNTVRAASVTRPESIKFLIVSTLYGTKWYLLRMLSVKPFIYSLFFLFTAVLLLAKQIELKTWDAFCMCLLSIFAAVFTTMAVVGSGFYSMSIIPPERALFVAIYMILICFTVFSFTLDSLILKSKTRYLNLLIWIIVLLNLFTSFLLIGSVILNWSGVYTQIDAYAAAWDSEERNLVTEIKSGQQPTLKNISPVGELDSFTDNKGWVASCIAGYFKLQNVRITQ